jgi:hypothetical protein
MKSLTLLCLIFISSGCASIKTSYSENAVPGSGAISAAEVFLVSFDELLSCPIGVASRLGIDRPKDACEQKAIPQYEAKIQSIDR